MNFNTLRITLGFVGLRFTQVFFQKLIHKQTCSRINKLQNVSKFHFFGTLAFVWSMKKTNSNSTKEDQELLITKTDDLFENRQYEQCYNMLMNCKNQEDVEVQWRLSRVIYNISKEVEKNKVKRKELITRAYNIISNVLQENWDHYAVHKWYAILLDCKSENEGIKQRIKQLEEVKKHMDLSVTLNPNDSTTLHMLGEWCYQIADMPWYRRKIAETLFSSPPHSTYEDALEYFLRAEAAQPRFYSLNLLRIGNCYLKLKKDDQAKYYLILAASYPAKSNDDYRANKEAAELLKSIK